MGIGVSIFLLAVGAILAFAVEAEVSGLDLAVVGYILMAAGLIGLLLTMFLWGPRKRSSVQQTSTYDPNRPGGPVVQEHRSTYDGGTPPPAI
jgi:hypothetical protein